MNTILQAEKVKWPSPHLRGKCTEKEIFSVVAKEVLLLVADSLTLELEYRETVSRCPGITFGSNRMGDPLVWHGRADAFINTTIPVHKWNVTELECEGIVSSEGNMSSMECICQKHT